MRETQSEEEIRAAHDSVGEANAPPNSAAVADTGALRGVKPYKAIFPILIGLGVVAFMLYREFDPSALDYVQWGRRAWIFLPLAFILMMGRDLGYVWRLMVLSEGRLGFWRSLEVIMLWEFTSAITPSAIGGTSVAILYVHKAGLSVGRSSGVVMATSFLDELYFLIMFPLLLMVVGRAGLFDVMGVEPGVRTSLLWFAWGGYSLKAAYVLVLSYGFFVNPRGLKWLLLKIFRLRPLRRWRHGANRAGYEIIETAREFRRKGPWYWAKAFGTTFLSWTSRYWVANAILLAFFVMGDQFIIFARQLVMWIMMLIFPTPGGSGFAEYIFSRYLGEFIPVSAVALPSVIIVLALLWRLATYYPYLLVGVIIFPRWMRRHFHLRPRDRHLRRKSRI